MNPQSPRFEVVVVGAGPAGALTARALARQGRRVALMDRAAFPRPKVCGDCLNPSCWDIWQRQDLENSFRALASLAASGVVLEKEGRPVFRLEMSAMDRGQRVMERSVLDAWLVGEAQASGVTFFPETTVEWVADGGRLETSRGMFVADLILGADGRNSVVARSSGLQAGAERRCDRVAWQTTLAAATLDRDIHMNVFPEGYSGVVREGVSRANLCVVLPRSGALTADAVADRYFPGVRRDSWRAIHPLRRSAARLGRERVWLVGDAARVVEPFTGEGIYFALASGELAAEHGERALRTGRPEEALRGYQQAHQRLYQRRVRVSRLTRWCLEKPARAGRVLEWGGRFPQLLEWLALQVQQPAGVSV